MVLLFQMVVTNVCGETVVMTWLVLMPLLVSELSGASPTNLALTPNGASISSKSTSVLCHGNWVMDPPVDCQVHISNLLNLFKLIHELDSHDSASESYLSDRHGRRVTPRISVDPDRLGSLHESDNRNRDPSGPPSLSAPRRGRPPKSKDDKNAEAQNGAKAVLAHKRQVGGTGFENSGALLVNEKRRKGLGDNEEEDGEIIDSEDF